MTNETYESTISFVRIGDDETTTLKPSSKSLSAGWDCWRCIWSSCGFSSDYFRIFLLTSSMSIRSVENNFAQIIKTLNFSKMTHHLYFLQYQSQHQLLQYQNRHQLLQYQKPDTSCSSTKTDTSCSSTKTDTTYSISKIKICETIHLTLFLRVFTCPKALCQEFLAKLKLPSAYFDAKYDRCYCKKCHQPKTSPQRCESLVYKLTWLGLDSVYILMMHIRRDGML